MSLEVLHSNRVERLKDHPAAQLAARVADLFDQYQVFRPDWIRRYWDQGRNLPGDAAR